MGFGVVAGQSTGYPGYNSITTQDKATIGRTLKDNRYWTSWFGKNHNTPEFQASAGPFNQWPIGLGFDRSGNVESFVPGGNVTRFVFFEPSMVGKWLES